MRALHTPQKTNSLVFTARAVTFLSPLVVVVHFTTRLLHGDYPWDGDSIAIPIFSYLMLVFPFNLLFLILGLCPYKPAVFLLAWNPRRFWWSAGWTILSIFPSLISDSDL